MTRPLDVDTDHLRATAASFVAAAEQIAELDADAPLADAAAAVPALRTAAACAAAITTVLDDTTSIADMARTFGADLRSAAETYEATDDASAAQVDGVEVPATAPR
ncbi:ESX-1 secretion-associated protein [Mycolicibacterium sp. PAM1]|uniref:type VII secretion target n=1 Tax=Mycolicibacterium sp. PAM1 TaxID=2853535 RepID=UPI001C3D0CC5|nr:type VII secretion target [Mycolicibacterium sp. PAM1]MBV5246500.1 ESX-1 secretion-associated protein [Mycolicibacterium sp. PAM1]